MIMIIITIPIPLNLEKIEVGRTDRKSTKNIEIVVSLKYLSNLQRTLEIRPNNCEVTLMLN